MSIRPLRQSVRPSPVFLAIVAITAAGGAWPGSRSPTRPPWPTSACSSSSSFGWLVSLCLHEFGHAYTAWRFGDHDVAVRGYLTLNPLKYSSPLLSLGLPVLFIALGGIGLPGGAVYVRTCVHDRAAEDAGQPGRPGRQPGVRGAAARAHPAALRPGARRCSGRALAFLGFLQVTALLLNLLPIPGLDGYGALEPHLSPETQPALQPAKQLGFFILLSC